MAHYTMMSGRPTVTVSITCPHCGRRQVVSKAERTDGVWRARVPAHRLFCSEDCRETWGFHAVLAANEVLPIFCEDYAFLIPRIEEGFLPYRIAKALQGVPG